MLPANLANTFSQAATLLKQRETAEREAAEYLTRMDIDDFFIMDQEIDITTLKQLREKAALAQQAEMKQVRKLFDELPAALQWGIMELGKPLLLGDARGNKGFFSQAGRWSAYAQRGSCPRSLSPAA